MIEALEADVGRRRRRACRQRRAGPQELVVEHLLLGHRPMTGVDRERDLMRGGREYGGPFPADDLAAEADVADRHVAPPCVVAK
jgi:hypothetical protein